MDFFARDGGVALRGQSGASIKPDCCTEPWPGCTTARLIRVLGDAGNGWLVCKSEPMRQSADVRRPRGERVPSRALVRATRVERVAAIKRAESAGQTAREIAASLGLAVSTIRIYRRDPDGKAQRARHERYRGRCRECGAATTGSRGGAKAPEWCAQHAPRQRRRWSDEQILGAIRKWRQVTGAPPALADWSPASRPVGP